MIINTLLAVVATSILSSGVVAFLLKKWIEHSFSARLAEIEATNRMQAHEHQIRFTRFDEKVTAAIEGAYEIVCEYSGALRSAIQQAYAEGPEAASDSFTQTEEIARKFHGYMQRQSIYLPAGMADKLRSTRLALRDALTDELNDLRVHQDRGDKPKSILVGSYKNAGLLEICDELMVELQEMMRKHLSQFVLKH